MTSPSDVAFGVFIGVGLVGMAHVVWLLWATRTRSVRWPRHYRTICTGCANAHTSDTGAR